MPCPFVALTHFLALNDCGRWLIIDLLDVVVDGNIYMAAFHDCSDPSLENGQILILVPNKQWQIKNCIKFIRISSTEATEKSQKG